MDPAGRFSTTYRSDRALVRTGPQAISLGVFLVGLLALAIFASPRVAAVLTGMAITTVATVGLQITTGYAGQINLGQSAFMGVGAFATALLASRGGLPFWAALPIAGVISGVCGYVFGLSAVRIKGFYLALTTIAAQVLFQFAVLNLPSDWLGGSSGLSVPAARLGGRVLTSDRDFLLLALGVCVLMVWGALGIVHGRFGRAFVAVRDDEVAAGMTGLPVWRVKAFACLVGAFYAGVGGGLMAYQLRFTSVDQFTMFGSVWLIAMIIVGGLGSTVGAVVGAVLIKTAQEVLATVGPLLAESIPSLGNSVVFASMNVFLGGIIALFLIFEPRGLMYRWSILKRTYRRWPFPY
jgi:branched-chain amino acid transport system permease protein